MFDHDVEPAIPPKGTKVIVWNEEKPEHPLQAYSTGESGWDNFIKVYLTDDTDIEIMNYHYYANWNVVQS